MASWLRRRFEHELVNGSTGVIPGEGTPEMLVVESRGFARRLDSDPILRRQMRAAVGGGEIRVGADFPVATMDIARAELDPNDLRRFMLTGRPIDAATAAARGIVDHLVAAEEVAARAEAEAQALAALPPQTYAAIKSQIRGPVLEVLDANVQAEAARPERRWFRDETKAAMAKMLA